MDDRGLLGIGPDQKQGRKKLAPYLFTESESSEGARIHH